jgi:hypothetical protein
LRVKKNQAQQVKTMVNVITKKIWTTTSAEDEVIKDYTEAHPNEGVINRNLGATDMDRSYSIVELTFGYYLEENIKNPSEYWVTWVGSQTPEEFVSYNSENQSNEEAISDYVEETAKSLENNEDDLEEVKKGLLKYLEQYIKEEEAEDDENQITLTILMPSSLRESFKKKCIDLKTEMSYVIRKNIIDMLDGKIPIAIKPKTKTKKSIPEK